MLEKGFNNQKITPPGKLSTRPRFAEIGGKCHWFPFLQKMDDALDNVLDRYSTRHEQAHHKYDKPISGASAWVLSGFLALHPFSDGNGRLGHLLCNYILSSYHPFLIPFCRNPRYLETLLYVQKTNNIAPLYELIITETNHE